jgi:hypothetical protein
VPCISTISQLLKGERSEFWLSGGMDHVLMLLLLWWWSCCWYWVSTPSLCLCSSSLIHSIWSSNTSSTSSVVSPSCSVTGIGWVVVVLVRISGGCANMICRFSHSCSIGASSLGVRPNCAAAKFGCITDLGGTRSSS